MLTLICETRHGELRFPEWGNGEQMSAFTTARNWSYRHHATAWVEDDSGRELGRFQAGSYRGTEPLPGEGWVERRRRELGLSDPAGRTGLAAYDRSLDALRRRYAED